MTYDFSQFKVPVFPNINDKPVAPTQSKAGNGADLIYRLNSLIDKLESSLNSLSLTSPIVEWKITLPNSSDVKQLNIFYSNVSEHLLYQHTNLSFNESDLIKTFSISAELDVTIDISDLILQNGCGYYGFIFVDINNQNKPWSWFYTLSNFIPRGCAKASDNFIQVDTSSLNPGVSTVVVNCRLLEVVQPIGTVHIGLKDEELIIG